MANLEISQLDLECSGHRGSSVVSDDDDDDGESVCFSEGDEGSCYSQFYSTADGSNDDYNFDPKIGQVLDSRRVSSMAESDCSVDVENGVYEVKVHLGKVERDCRICHLTLEMDGRNQESGIAIELGCSCKNDLAAAHKHCAETWFKIKGNKTCEICNSIACNVVGSNDIESAPQTSETNATAASATSAPVSSTTETRTCLNGHHLLNFLLACMVFAFVVSWFFHFNIPS